MKILVVEDDIIIKNLLEQVVIAWDYEVEAYDNAMDALEACKKEFFPLIITDIGLPRMNGLEFCRKVRELPLGEFSVILVETGQTGAKTLNSVLEAGADDYLNKPIELSRLKIHLAIAEKRVMDRLHRRQAEEALKKANEELEEKVKKRTAELEELNRKLRDEIAERIAISQENQELYIQANEDRKRLDKLNRELMRLDEIKSKFIQLASHELNTPLAILNGYNEILKYKLPPEYKPILQRSSETLKRLSKIVENISQLANLTNPDVEFEGEIFSITSLINDLAVEVSLFMDIRKLELTVDLPEYEIFAEIDPHSIWLAMMNLLLNAIRFTKDGGKIKISAEVIGENVQISVEDTGIGIPESEYNNIFKQFYEIRNSDYHSSGTIEFGSGGMGLGLSIAKAAIERHGGKIWVESEVGKGSKFTFIIPQKQNQMQNKNLN